jgi:hypothetical protein
MLKALVESVRVDSQEEPWKTVLVMDRAREIFHPGKDHNGGSLVGSLVSTLSIGDDLQELLFNLLLLFPTNSDEETAYPQFLYGIIFTTLDEGRLSVVSARAREGDIVWFLDGDTYTPIILRP